MRDKRMARLVCRLRPGSRHSRDLRAINGTRRRERHASATHGQHRQDTPAAARGRQQRHPRLPRAEPHDAAMRDRRSQRIPRHRDHPLAPGPRRHRRLAPQSMTSPTWFSILNNYDTITSVIISLTITRFTLSPLLSPLTLGNSLVGKGLVSFPYFT